MLKYLFVVHYNTASGEDPGALLKALGDDEEDVRLEHGDAANLADPLVVPVSQPPHELELELIQSQMAQKPMLRGEVGARAWRV